ncbi:hypothetical protein [Streptomyces antimycoticus]|uniref:hypothetical protein n=1 Tax=Streptomyces TaxID=1883 RepID=UPI0033C68924
MGLSDRVTTEELRAEAKQVEDLIASEKAMDAVRPPSPHLYADTNLASYEHRLKEIKQELKRR